MTHGLRIGSLFSGIGALELGLEMAAVGRTVWQVERSDFCRSVLARHWPDARRHDDIRTASAALLGPADVVCGGFPCQDVSQAGRGAGLDGGRSGLWYEMLRIVSEVRPRFVVVENVASLLSRGLHVVLSGLAQIGFDLEWSVLRASDVGAPHERPRLFVLAYAHGAELRQQQGRRRRTGGPGEAEPKCRASAAEPVLGRLLDGATGRLARWPAGRGAEQHEWEPPRSLAGVTSRRTKLAALGNAVVPQVAAVVGRRIVEIEGGAK